MVYRPISNQTHPINRIIVFRLPLSSKGYCPSFGGIGANQPTGSGRSGIDARQIWNANGKTSGINARPARLP